MIVVSITLYLFAIWLIISNLGRLLKGSFRGKYDIEVTRSKQPIYFYSITITHLLLGITLVYIITTVLYHKYK